MEDSQDPRPLVAIVGATASGKSGMAFALARSYPLEVVSADSIQIYRGLEVGAAKPPPEMRRQVPHHMLDVAEPTERYSAASYAREARKVLDGVYGRGRVPLVVGGSGLYLRALLKGIFNGPPADAGLRERLEELARREGDEVLHERLKAADPEAASRVHPRDRRRVIRALEVTERAGEPMSRLQREGRYRSFSHPLVLGLRWQRAALYARIDRRAEAMVKGGLAAEVRRLLDEGLPVGSPALEGLGYHHFVRVVRGELEEGEALRLLKRDTRRFAKRQTTWFKKVPEVRWVDVSEENQELALSLLAREVEAYLKGRGVLGGSSARAENVILIGFKGSGKSTVGRLLARRLGRHFLDLDGAIEKKFFQERGRSLTFREIYRELGEKNFRALELRCLEEALSGGGKVIALGGGTPLAAPEAAELLRGGSLRVVLLHLEAEELFRRISPGELPAFLDPHSPRESFQRLYEERLPLYRSVASLEVAGEGKSPEELVEEVAARLGLR